MSLASDFTYLKAKAYDVYGKSPSKMLLHTGAIGWLLSSTAQVTGVMLNDKLSAKEKKFLIPQEIADGAINIISFFMITVLAIKFADKLVTTGKIVTRPVRDYVEKFRTPKMADLKKDFMKDLAETRPKVLDSAFKLGDVSTNLKDIVKFDKDIKKAYYDFSKGVEVIASTTGAVVSSNFITPYLRNCIGAKVQKRSINQVSESKPYVVQRQSRLGIEDYKQRAILKTSFPATGSSLKV